MSYCFSEMCRGIQETTHRSEEAVSSSVRNCELCNSRALVYCQADDAFLCQKCDRSVHGANVLALRHIRSLLCDRCQKPTLRYLIGASVEVMLPTIAGLSEGLQCEDTDNIRSGSPKLPFQFV